VLVFGNYDSPLNKCLCLIYYLHYVSWAGFHTFHTFRAKRVIDYGRHPFLNSIFLTSIHAIVTTTAFSDYRYMDILVVFESLHFTRSQELCLRAHPEFYRHFYPKLLSYCSLVFFTFQTYFLRPLYTLFCEYKYYISLVRVSSQLLSFLFFHSIFCKCYSLFSCLTVYRTYFIRIFFLYSRTTYHDCDLVS
jgi:hypothetical protein